MKPIRLPWVADCAYRIEIRTHNGTRYARILVRILGTGVIHNLSEDAGFSEFGDVNYRHGVPVENIQGHLRELWKGGYDFPSSVLSELRAQADMLAEVTS